MHFPSNDDHDEDDLPVISLPTDLFPFRRDFQANYRPPSTDNDYPTKLVGNWHTLYQASLQSLQSVDEDPSPPSQKPYYFGRPTTPADSQSKIQTFSPPSMHQAVPTIDAPPSSYHHSQIEPDTATSKWQIRLPELLNCTVGPDRQKRNTARRHTTTIVFQVADRRKAECDTPHADQLENQRSITPIVKQLRQKFDQMASNEDVSSHTGRSSSLSSWTSLPRLSRATSLTCRGLTTNTTERVSRTPRPMLPVRPSAELTTLKPRASSAGPTTSHTTTTNGRASRERSGPPVSYPKHFYPPPSTTTVVKQLLDAGASLVYDSTSQSAASRRPPPVPRHERSIDKRADDLHNSHTLLTGRSLPPDTTSDTYAKVKPRTSVRRPSRQLNHNESDNIYCEPIARRSSNLSAERRPFPTSSRPPLNGRLKPADYEPENYYAVYDMTK